MPNINYQDPLHLAVMVQGRLSVDRPDALVVITSNPGEDDKHYIALVQRVYSNKNDLNSFVGYITYRYREVRFRKKESYLPAFSSIEIRDADFNEYNPPVKIHFDPKKVQAEDSNLYLLSHFNSPFLHRAPSRGSLQQKNRCRGVHCAWHLSLYVIRSRSCQPKPRSRL